GLRNEHTERFDAGDDDAGQGGNFAGSDGDGWARQSAPSQREPLDLSGDMREPSASQDEFELGDEQGAESPLASKPVRKPLQPGEGGGEQGGKGGSAGGSLPGNTLFERMANLSRGTSSSDADADDEDDDGDNGGGLNIPRFLGRQNNQ
ncbi:MAG: cell division protein FtsZ, partial [Pseudomonadota bacterium]|nr:cell division protein FtsZ [Pseudomonadota bacterium]